MLRSGSYGTLRAMTTNLCHLKRTIGQVERCPEERCAFWESGGAVLAAGCAIERLGLTHELERTPGLAGLLVDLRGQLEEAATHDERRELNSRFDQLLPPELRDD